MQNSETRAISPPIFSHFMNRNREVVCDSGDCTKLLSMNRIAPARELFHGLFCKYRKKISLNALRIAYIISDAISILSYMIVGQPVRLLFRHYAVACSLRRFRECEFLGELRFFRFNDVSAIYRMPKRKQYTYNERRKVPNIKSRRVVIADCSFSRD